MTALGQGQAEPDVRVLNVTRPGWYLQPYRRPLLLFDSVDCLSLEENYQVGPSGASVDPKPLLARTLSGAASATVAAVRGRGRRRGRVQSVVMVPTSASRG